VFAPRPNQKNRSLENYKQQQAAIAKSNGVYEQLIAAKTLTAAREIVYGKKRRK